VASVDDHNAITAIELYSALKIGIEYPARRVIFSRIVAETLELISGARLDESQSDKRGID